MRKIYLLLSLLTFAAAAAQTITQSFNEPVIGDIDKLYRLDTSAYTSRLPVDVTGSSCIWDYTKLGGAFPMVVDSFIAPSAAVNVTAYPGASYVQHRDILYTFYKSTTNPQQTELLGAYSPSLSLYFSDPAIIASYPISYGYSLSDPVTGTFKANSQNGACVGSIAISATGQGTVNFPNNVSIPSILCLKSVEVLTLSIGIFPFGTFNQTIYNYYMPGKKFPILNINYTTYQLISGGTPTITASIYGSDNYFGVSGLNELGDDENFGVYPNPFSDRLFTNAKKANKENEYSFYNTKGELVLQLNSLDTRETDKLAHGIYFLEIKNKSGIYRQKVIKE